MAHGQTLRPARPRGRYRVNRVREFGMFFAWSGTVPGVGVSMVLISGKLAASRGSAYLREPRR